MNHVTSWITLRHESRYVMNHVTSWIMLRHESRYVMNQVTSWITWRHKSRGVMNYVTSWITWQITISQIIWLIRVLFLSLSYLFSLESVFTESIQKKIRNLKRNISQIRPQTWQLFPAIKSIWSLQGMTQVNVNNPCLQLLYQVAGVVDAVTFGQEQDGGSQGGLWGGGVRCKVLRVRVM